MENITNPHLKCLIQFYLWTGCRRSEAAELTWDDIDWQNKFIYLGHPASQTKLRRAFPMTNRLQLLLEQQLNGKESSNKVFSRFTVDIRWVSRQIRKISEVDSRLPNNLTLHTLRHTFASHLVMQGVDLSTIANLLGHSTSQVTEMYSHLQPEHKQAAADKLPY